MDAAYVHQFHFLGAKDQSTVVHGAEMTVDRCPLMSLSICWILVSL